jgi:hypothetical protein
VLTADAAEAFKEGKGLYDPAVAERLRRHIFSVATPWTRPRRTAPSAGATRASTR